MIICKKITSAEPRSIFGVLMLCVPINESF